MDALLENFEVSLENIKAVIKALNEKGKSDPEAAHIMEDNVIALTLKYLHEQKLTKKEMLEYIALLRELTMTTYTKWYA